MLKHKFHFLICSLVLLCLSNTAQASTHKVLVLHSYHQGMEWTDSISAGIQSVLGPKFNEIEVYYEYLDSMRNPSAEHAENLIELFRSKTHNIDFDLILTIDNNALQFINRYGQKLYPNIPIVFAGINHFDNSLIDNIDQVTGITEEPDIQGTLQLMLKVHPEAQRIVIVVDQSDTGLIIKKALQEKVAPLFNERVKLEYYSDFTWEGIQADMAALGDKDLVYLLTLNRDRDNHFISYREGMDIVNRSARVPIYGSWDYYMGKGIVGGVITSGFSQGSQAAALALRVLSGESANSIAIKKDTSQQTVFDFAVMQEKGIQAAQLPKNVHFINKPAMLIERFQKLPAWALFSLVFVLLLLLIQSKSKRLIAQQKERLAQQVSEKVLQLNDNAEKLNKLIDTLPFPIFYKDRACSYQLCNDAFANTILGISKEQITGRTLYDLPEQIPEKLADLYNSNDISLMENPGTQSYEAKVKCVDDMARYYRFYKATLNDASGNVSGIVGAMLDITESRQIHQEREKLIKELERANSNLQQIAIMDSLTAIYNRHYIFERLPEELLQAKRYGYPLSVALIDIDHFKQINDSFGHLYGDLVLQRISQVMKEMLRTGDLLCRYGGEEFLVILPHTRLEQALTYANRLRESVAALSWDKPELIVTLSGGVAEYRGESETLLLNRADTCLYQAKSQGRNIIVS